MTLKKVCEPQGTARLYKSLLWQQSGSCLKSCPQCPLGLDCPTAVRKLLRGAGQPTHTAPRCFRSCSFWVLTPLPEYWCFSQDSALLWSANKHEVAYSQALPSQQSSCMLTLAWVSVLPNQGANCTAPWKGFLSHLILFTPVSNILYIHPYL